jgi:hypothetical protein
VCTSILCPYDSSHKYLLKLSNQTYHHAEVIVADLVESWLEVFKVCGLNLSTLRKLFVSFHISISSLKIINPDLKHGLPIRMARDTGAVY